MSREPVFDPNMLPLSEIARILRKHKGVFGRNREASVIRIADIHRELKMLDGELNRIVNGKPTLRKLGKVKLRQLSRFLLKLEAGYIVKRAGKIVYLDEPMEIKKPDILFNVLFSPHHRPTIRIGQPPVTLKVLPNIFKLSGLMTKGLR